jgi:hypothetical protein
MKILLTFLCVLLAAPAFAQKSGMLQLRGGSGGGATLAQVTNVVNALAGTNSVDGKLDITNGTARGFRTMYTTGTTNPPFRVNNSNGLAILFVNTNRFIGINKTNPAVMLDVAGAGAFSGALDVAGTLTANGDLVIAGSTAGESATFTSLGVGSAAIDASGVFSGPQANISGVLTSAQFRVTGLRVLGNGTNDGTFYLPSLQGGYVLISGANSEVAETTLTEAQAAFLATAVTAASSNLSGLHNVTQTGTNTAAVFVTTGAGAGVIELLATNGIGASFKAAISNSVAVTNIVGLLHKAAAATLVLDANHGNQFSITSRVAAATSVILTNTAEGQDIEFTILGEASGGSSRVITVIPQSGQLVANLDTFGTALATSFSFTLTNGNAAEVSTRIRKLNGTNIASVVSRQFSF